MVQKLQSMVTCPYVLDQNIMVVGMCGRGVFHLVAARKQRDRGKNQGQDKLFKGMPWEQTSSS
jgi:hypothetical protein